MPELKIFKISTMPEIFEPNSMYIYPEINSLNGNTELLITITDNDAAISYTGFNSKDIQSVLDKLNGIPKIRDKYTLPGITKEVISNIAYTDNRITFISYESTNVKKLEYNQDGTLNTVKYYLRTHPMNEQSTLFALKTIQIQYNINKQITGTYVSITSIDSNNIPTS